MLKLRYNQMTKQVTGWCGYEDRFDKFTARHPDDLTVLLDIPIPPLGSRAYLYDEQNEAIIPNPDYVPHLHRNPIKEIDNLKKRIEELEKK